MYSGTETIRGIEYFSVMPYDRFAATTHSGKVLMTTDYGATWTQSQVTSTPLRDIVYRGSKLWVVGDGGKVFTSWDGVNWGALTSNTTSLLYAITWSSPGVFYCAGSDPAVIIKTTDYGSTWVQQSIPTVNNLLDIRALYPDGTAWAVGWSGTILYTSDGGDPGSVTVTSPNGGECWYNDSTQNITWSWTGNISNVKLELSTNGGSSWSTIISSTPNDGTHPWIPTNVHATQCRVRVSDVSNSATNDVSNANFCVCDRIAVTSPNGSSRWRTGSSQTITWETAGISGNVKIELSTNGGTSWGVTIVSSTSDDGSYTWTVSCPLTSNARVKVTHTTYTSNFGISAPFVVGISESETGGVPVVSDELRSTRPEPFRRWVSIYFALSCERDVSLTAYDARGRGVWSHADRFSAGQHSIRWDGRDRVRNDLPEGIYFCRMVAGDYTATRKMVKTD